MENRTRTYIEEFISLHDANVWLTGHYNDYITKDLVWQITQCSVVFRENLFKTTFSVSNQKAMTQMTKKNIKIKYDLVPPEVIHAIAETLTVNNLSGKYSDREWEKGRSWSGEFGAVMRHLWKWWNPLVSDNDDETGLSHLYHAVTRLSFLVAYEERGKSTNKYENFDDKPRP